MRMASQDEMPIKTCESRRNALPLPSDAEPTQTAMKHDADKRHGLPIRLPGYDYTQATA
jgi:hypothetical protein